MAIFDTAGLAPHYTDPGDVNDIAMSSMRTAAARRDLAASNAFAKSVASHTNDTGVTDYSAVRSDLAHGNSDANYALSSNDDSINSRRAQDLDNALAKRNIMSSSLGSLYNDPSDKNLHQQADILRREFPGMSGDVDDHLEFMKTLGHGDRRQVAKNLMISTLGPEGQASIRGGQNVDIDNGQTVGIGTRNSALMGGDINVNQTYNKKISPEGLAGAYEYDTVDENGNKVRKSETQAQRLAQADPDLAARVGAGVNYGGDGSYRAPGTTISAPESHDADFDLGMKTMQGLQATSPERVNRKELLRRYKEIQEGLDPRLRFTKVAQIGNVGTKLGLDNQQLNEQVTRAQELNKISSQLSESLGHSSDADLREHQHMLPSQDNTPDANNVLMSENIARENFDDSRLKLLQDLKDRGVSPAQYGRIHSDFTRNYSPSVMSGLEISDSKNGANRFREYMNTHFPHSDVNGRDDGGVSAFEKQAKKMYLLQKNKGYPYFTPEVYNRISKYYGGTK